MGGVNITLANGQLGQTIQTNDGICGMVLTGAVDGTGDYVLGTPVLITSAASLESVGITTDGNEFAVRHVEDFYSMAGAGAQLYLMLVADTMTVESMADVTNANGAKKLLDYAAGRIKLLAVMSDDDAVTTVVANALNGDVYDAVTKMEVLAQHFVSQQMPFRAIIGGTSYTGVPANLSDLTTRSDNRSAVLVGDTQSGKGAAIGLLLGTLASIPVQRKASRVATGALPVTAAYLSTAAVEAVPYDEPIITGKGFITWKTYPHKSGYFWSGDHTATADTDDYNLLCRGRIIDKAHILAYKTFVDVVDDEVPVDPGSGKMAAGYCRALEQAIENQINNTMTTNREISSITAFVDPEQNVLSTGIVAVNLGIVPVGYSSVIEVTLGFVNPAL